MSTSGQDAKLQLDALVDAGVQKRDVFADVTWGSKTAIEQPRMKKLLAYVEPDGRIQVIDMTTSVLLGLGLERARRSQPWNNCVVAAEHRKGAWRDHHGGHHRCVPLDCQFLFSGCDKCASKGTNIRPVVHLKTWAIGEETKTMLRAYRHSFITRSSGFVSDQSKSRS